MGGDLYHPIWADSGPLKEPRRSGQRSKPKPRGSEAAFRTALMKNPPKVVPPKMRRLLKRDGDRCCWCSHPIAPARKIYLWEKHLDVRRLTHRVATIEHVDPRSNGGSNRLTNLKLACLSCNSRRLEDPSWDPNTPI